jgi:hypothetical protein
VQLVWVLEQEHCAFAAFIWLARKGYTLQACVSGMLFHEANNLVEEV